VTFFHVRPWHPLTISSYERVKKLLPQCVDPGVSLIAATQALVVSGLCGDFEGGDRIAMDTESLAVQKLSSPSDAAWWFGQVGWLRFIEARYEEALVYVQKGCQIAESNNLRALLRHLLLWRYTIEWRAVGWSESNATIAEIESIPRPHQPIWEAWECAYKARQLIHLGQCNDAADLAMLSHSAASGTGSSLSVLVWSLVNANILLAAGRTDDAKPLLSEARQLIERAPIYDCWRAATMFAEAWLAYTKNDTARTLDLLQQSLGLARTGKQRHHLRYCDDAMKPLFRLALEQEIEVDLVQDLIRMFRVTPPAAAPDNWPWPVHIVTLGLFEIRINGEPVKFSRKLPRKTLLLLKAIVAFGGQDVPEQLLADALWGDEDGDAARNALSITVIRLRKLLGTSDAVLQLGGRVSLNSACCWVDASVFEAAIDASGGMPEKILNLYGGSFLPDDLDESWSVAARERLRGKFIHALSSHGALLEIDGNLSGAIQCYLRGIDADQIVESFHQGLMRCYEKLGRRSEAFSVYRRLRDTLSVILGVPPADETNRLFQDMLERQSAEGLSASLSDIDASKVSRLQPKKRSGR
jgi:DNA-binding SARP family transcriptional activator